MSLPKYKSHKEVWAGKIAAIHYTGNGGALLQMEDEEVQDFIRVTPAYVAKHNPLVGGYYVLYADGYESWSPADAFESGYTRIA